MNESQDNTGCPFCKPEIRNLSFYENSKFIAIYNIAPILPGHTLVIPKKHLISFFDLADKDLFEFIKFSRTVIRILSKAFNTEAFNWTLQEKAEAGQSIAHMHIHVMPRKPEDLPHPGDWYPKLKYNIGDILDSHKRAHLTEDQLAAIIEKLRSTATEVVKEMS
jgi:bis(5'-adenosyl)-triphosphatase